MNEKKKKLIDYLRTQKKPPTVKEMKKAIGTQSNNFLYSLLDSLEEQGFIKRDKGRWRSVRLVSSGEVDEEDGWVKIPMLGSVAAGQPIEAILIPETMSVPRDMLRKGKDHFGLKVRGNSMIDANIVDGDRIALQQASTAENGDIVVALIDGENATVKKFQRNGGKIRLEPANKDFETLEIEAERVTVQGVFVGLIRYRR